MSPDCADQEPRTKHQGLVVLLPVYRAHPARSDLFDHGRDHRLASADIDRKIVNGRDVRIEMRLHTADSPRP